LRFDPGGRNDAEAQERMMMTRGKKLTGYGGAVAFAICAALVACESDDPDDSDQERIAGEISYPADSGREIIPDTPRPEPIDSAAADDTFALNEPPWPPSDCIASVKPDRVHIQDEPMLVTYTFAIDFPEPDSVLADTNSGIAVESLDKKLTLVKLNLSRATEGRWAIRFLGSGDRACDGTLTVRRPS
jgi:hypothetical protein